jgi:hypothetical protein
VIGLTVTSEWYLAGFENYVNNARWQIKWQAHSYVDLWADPNGAPWSAAIESPCASNSTSPDRIVFVVLSWNTMTQAQWETQITNALNTIKSKYTAVKRFDLMTNVRGPNNQACGASTSGESVSVPAELDAAIAAVAARPANAGLVYAGPKFEADNCTAFDGAGPHLLTAGAQAMAAKIGAYFANLQ